MSMSKYIPDVVPNNINGRDVSAISNETIDKLNPATGTLLCRLARSSDRDVNEAVKAAMEAQPVWADRPPVQRGMMLHDFVMGLKARREEIARIVALETGKSPGEALGETDGAIALGLFFAGEGQRLYARTTTSSGPGKYALTIRQPVGVAGLIIAANTPIANVAWKIFPALICGNGVVLKAAEDTPATAWIVAKIATESGLPAGILNIIQGLGEEAGAPLVAHNDVGIVSFTGSTQVGRLVAGIAGKRLAKISLELGGKNPLVVCDDADLDNACKWVLLSVYSNAGQRCASASRIIIFDSVYEQFRDQLITETAKLKVGPTNDHFYGPVINEQQLKNMIGVVTRAKENGATILCGGDRMLDEEHAGGFYMASTLLENAGRNAEISQVEMFGPIACLNRCADFAEALSMANDSPYGLTACIHTTNVNRAIQFTQKVQAGVAMVNAGTYGSEPHMPFGGLKQSGNGSREPGTEALDIYSDLKDVYIQLDTSKL